MVFLSPQESTGFVNSVKRLAGETYLLRFERNGRPFEPGQYLAVGAVGRIDMREYSIYSPLSAGYFEVLIKKVSNGSVSRQLSAMKSGDTVRVDGPFGFFTIDANARENKELVFIATGTGISPFHCFAQSYPSLDYRVLHGVRYCDEAVYHAKTSFARDRYIICSSRDDGDYRGRVTDWLRENQTSIKALYYLCGNCDMIYEAFDLLQEKGVPSDQLFAEVYF